ncbi:hypothetical protein [Moraxella oblonga]|uniref:hypothetical protein n=1 Tax=Moraxella oblonga TaxID=200413 RepID=UPI0008341870|nr:hypothetical protein [Moraxella oblonga]
MNHKFYHFYFIIAFILLSSACSKNCNDDLSCEITNQPLEDKLSLLTLNSFPDNLAKKPLYWSPESKTSFPKIINLPYIYIADKQGLWVRYSEEIADDYLNTDYYLDKTAPAGYVYEERSVEQPKPENVYSYGEWNIQLKSQDNIIYQQNIHDLTRLDISGFSLHSERGSTHLFPNNVQEHLATLKSLQIKLPQYAFPEQQLNTTPSASTNQIDVNNLPTFSGNQVCKTLKNHTFEWKTQQGNHIIRFNPLNQNETRAICGQKFNAILVQHKEESYHGYCRDTNRISVYLINSQQPFSKLEKYSSEEFYLKDGYALKDVVAYRIYAQEFHWSDEYAKWQKNKPREHLWRFNVQLYDKKGETINYFCSSFPYEPIDKNTLPTPNQ